KDAPQANGDRFPRAVPGDEADTHPEQADHEPAGWHQRLENRRDPVHRAGTLEVAFQRLVLAIVPVRTILLSQPRPMPDQLLHERPGHLQADLRPPFAVSEVASADHEEEGDPSQEQERMDPPADPGAE